MKSQHFHFYGVNAEILEYLRSHPESKCTMTQMAKAEGVRKTPVSKTWLRKHLTELEKMGFIYSTRIQDPIGKTTFTYYTLVPRCAEEGALGVPEFVLGREKLYTSLVQSFYVSLAKMYIPLISDYCGLCASFQKTLAKELGCREFLRMHQSLIRNDVNKLLSFGLGMTEIEGLKRNLDQWSESEATPPPAFLEDWTIALVEYTANYGHETVCANCKYKRKCLAEGRRWVSGFLEKYLSQARDSYLKTFWKSFVAGTPRMDVSYLQKYFASRFDIKSGHNPFFFLKIYEETQSLPYFYSKVLPLSLVLLMEDWMMPVMKKFAEIPRQKSKAN